GVVAVIQVHVPMPLVRTAAGDQLKLTAAAGAAIGCKACSSTAELLYRVDRRIGGNGSKGARGEIVHIQSVDGGIGLVDTGACGRAGKRDAGLQRKQESRRGAVVHRQIIELGNLKIVSNAGIRGIQGYALTCR